MSVVGSFVPLFAKKPTEERVQHTAKKNVDSIVLWCRLRVSIMFRCLSFDRNKFNISYIYVFLTSQAILAQGCADASSNFYSSFIRGLVQLPLLFGRRRGGIPPRPPLRVELPGYLQLEALRAASA